MTQNIVIAIITLYLKIALLRGKPAIEDVNDFDPLLTKEETPWRFLAPVSGIALDTDVRSPAALKVKAKATLSA